MSHYAIEASTPSGSWYVLQTISGGNTDAFARKRLRYFRNRHQGARFRLVLVEETRTIIEEG